MQKLWIDDVRSPEDNTWTVARTVTSAINALVQFDFDEISLDHDISHQVVVGSVSRPYPCEETFMPVVHFLVEKYTGCCYDRPKPRITIHTANPVGGKAMREILEGHGFVVKLKPMGAVNRLETTV